MGALAVVRPRRRGSLTVEAALFLPAVALALLGGLEYGWMFLKQRQLERIAGELAAVGAAHAGTTEMVEESARRLLAAGGFGELECTLVLTPEGLGAGSLGHGDEFEVELSVAYAPLSLTGLARPAPALLPAPGRLLARASAAKHGAH